MIQTNNKSVSHAWVWWAILTALHITVSAEKTCLESTPKSWTADQKQRYCQAAAGGGWKSSIECAHQARSELKLKYDDVYLLCVDAANASPVQCMSSLSKKDREQYGIALCTRAVSDATSKCWQDLTQFKGKNKIVDTMQIINFCRELDGVGPINCVRNSHWVIGMDPALSLEPCANALMKADTETMNACLTHLKPHIYSSSSTMAAREHGKKGIQDTDAIDFCAAAPSSLSVECFSNSADMKLAASDRLKLCYGADSDTGPVNCFNTLLFDNKKLSSSSTHEPSDKDGASKSVVNERIALGIALCAMAPDDAPATCFNEGLKVGSSGITPSQSVLNAKSSGGKKSKRTAAVISQIDAFSDTDYTLLQLCQGSEGVGPVDCFRKSQAVFRPADLSSDSSLAWYSSMYGDSEHSDHGSGRGLGLEMRVHLCLHAPSSAPAECGLKAPQWLAASERVHLCAGASHESLPIRCLQSVEGPSKNFNRAPKKALGYFLENIVDVDAQHARAMTINMCSFSSSSNPLASAQCLVKAPVSLKLIDAVSLCTNVSISTAGEEGGDEEGSSDNMSDLESSAKSDGISASVFLSTCIRLAPRQWSSEELSSVCKGVRSGPEAQGAVTCAQGVMAAVGSMLRIGAHSKEASQLLPPAAAACHAWREDPKEIPDANATETTSGSKKSKRSKPKPNMGDGGADHYAATLSCVRSAISGLMSEGRTMEPEVIYETCSGAISNEPGLCLAKVASQWRMSFEDGARVAFCSAVGSMARFGCLLQLPPGKAVSLAAAENCLDEKVYAHSARPVKVWSSDPNDGPQVKSGVRFALDLQLYDQWEQPLIGIDNDIAVLVSLNSNNEQGAVLWGTRTNISSDGKIHFNSLTVSQPGTVELKLTMKSEDTERYGIVVLSVFRLIVKVNPDLQDTLYCTFIFKQAQCPADVSHITASNWENEFPQESAYFQPHHFIMCSACYKLITESWGVGFHISPVDGSSMATYRAGVDAIWTGSAGYPSEEMTYENILQLDVKTWNEEINTLKTKHAAKLRDVRREARGSDKLGGGRVSKELLARLQKMLKKAYYKKSLQWHPDRWSQYPLYTDAVTRAFELINEANSELNRQITELATPPAEYATDVADSTTGSNNPYY